MAASTKGWTWGDFALQDRRVVFNTNGEPAFEVALEDVASLSLPGKSELALEFHQPDIADRDLLCEMRLTLSTPEAAEALHEQLVQRTSLGQNSGEAVASLYDLPFVTPRGKYQLDLYATFFKLHGKTHDYKIMYKNVTKAFLLPKVDGLFTAFVIALDLPIRQGNTHYPFLVLEFNKEVEETVALKHAPEELGDRLDGKLFEVLSRLFKELAAVSIIIPGNFRSSSDSQAIKCSIKANEGLLYPLQKSFIFIHKPVLHIRFEDIRSVEFARVTEGTLATNRYFDLRITTEAVSYQFTGIDRQEYKTLVAFLEKKKLNISNLKEEDREQESAGEEMEVDESDEDFEEAD